MGGLGDVKVVDGKVLGVERIFFDYIYWVIPLFEFPPLSKKDLFISKEVIYRGGKVVNPY